jgi:hypothetical protein
LLTTLLTGLVLPALLLAALTRLLTTLLTTLVLLAALLTTLVLLAALLLVLIVWPRSTGGARVRSFACHLTCIRRQSGMSELRSVVRWHDCKRLHLSRDRFYAR